MNRMWTDESLSQLSDSVNGKFAGLASAVSDAMTEVHENMMELEGNICTDEEARGGVARLQAALDAVDSAVALLRNEIAGIVVPTKVSELQNDSGYKTTDTTYGAATAAAAGLMSAADKAKLDGIQAGAQVNQTVTKASLGLDKVNNTADAEKIVKGIATEAVPASADTERYIYFSRVADAADLARPVYDTELTYNPKQKRITARNLLLEKDAEEEVAVWVKNPLHAITLLVSKSGNAGVYDKTKSTWLVRRNENGVLLIGSTASQKEGTAAGPGSAVVCGQSCDASGTRSVVGGNDSEASGIDCIAYGQHAKSSANAATAFGWRTIANNNSSLAIGHANVEMDATGNANNSNGHALVIGKGTSDTARSNALSVMFDGTVKAAKTITASTVADYAENFEWADGNPLDKDLVGRFVTLDGKKVRIADGSDDYILGIISGQPFVLGNGDCDTWNGMYLRDDFGRMVMEPAPKIETDEETGMEIEVRDENGDLVYEGTRPVLNPDYDPSQTYISRADRSEWDPVGMLGVLSVVQDGTLAVNGYCMCGENGIATACDLPGCGYRVTEIINENVAKVVFREALPVSVGRKLQKLFENAS